MTIRNPLFFGYIQGKEKGLRPVNASPDSPRNVMVQSKLEF